MKCITRALNDILFPRISKGDREFNIEIAICLSATLSVSLAVFSQNIEGIVGIYVPDRMQGPLRVRVLIANM